MERRRTEGCPQRKRPSGDVTLIPPGRAYKMAAGVPFLPCYSYGVGFRLSRSLCLRYMRIWAAAVARGATRGVRKSMHLRGERNRCRFSLFLSTLVPRFLSFFPPPPFPARSTFLSPREYNLARAYLWSRGEGGGGGWSCVFGWMDIERTKESCQRGRN